MSRNREFCGGCGRPLMEKSSTGGKKTRPLNANEPPQRKRATFTRLEDPNSPIVVTFLLQNLRRKSRGLENEKGDLVFVKFRRASSQSAGIYGESAAWCTNRILDEGLDAQFWASL